MIRALVEQTFDQYKKYFVLAGSSQDTKPTAGVVTGSKFLEVDTGTEYAFDEASNEWVALGLTPEEAKAAIEDEVSDWLDAHPEATTTVEDGAISYAKLNASLKQKADDVSSLKSASTLQAENIPDTVQTITFDTTTGNVSQIVHKKRTDNSVTVRTDVFTFGTNTITEVRTLGTGESLTIVTNTETLTTTITYAAA